MRHWLKEHKLRQALRREYAPVKGDPIRTQAEIERTDATGYFGPNATVIGVPKSHRKAAR